MKKIKRYSSILSIACILLVAALPACQMTPQKKAVATITEVGHTGNSAYEAYLFSVAQGSVPTNDVPKITGLYREFQAAYGVATSAVTFSTNASLANPELLTTLTRLQTAISTVTKK